MGILLGAMVIAACLAVGVVAVVLFIAEMKLRRELRARGIIPLGWGMRIYPMTPIPKDDK